MDRAFSSFTEFWEKADTKQQGSAPLRGVLDAMVLLRSCASLQGLERRRDDNAHAPVRDNNQLLQPSSVRSPRILCMRIAAPCSPAS